MSTVAAVGWVPRPGLVIGPRNEDGRHVVKDAERNKYFTLRAPEAFLLQQLDGTRDAAIIGAAFAERFGEPLPLEDLQAFVQLALSRGLVQPTGSIPPPADPSPPPVLPAAPSAQPTAANPSRQSLLYFRFRLVDPDRCFTRLAPCLWFLWTRSFLVVSLAAILAALAVTWTNHAELVSYFAQSLRWETVLIVWLTLILETALHECCHGLTCKHYGGAVHEIGFLSILFIPCLYCNVSDSWLFPQKRNRLLVRLAGGYCDVCVWALAVFTWRLTPQDILLNCIAWVVTTVLGARIFFNFNPFLKLDGYYLLGDLLGIPNLQPRALEHLKGRLRQTLWGAACTPPANGKLLLAYGIGNWLVSLIYLGAMLAALVHILGGSLGPVGLLGSLAVGLFVARGFFQGVLGGEVRQMIGTRHRRTLAWWAGLAGLLLVLLLGQVEDRTIGTFQVRPVCCREIRAPVAGFLQNISCDEGDRVESGAIIARLEVPNLASRIAQKRADVREAEAGLRLLEIGPRREEIELQRRRVGKAQALHDRAARDLKRSRESFAEEMNRQDKQIVQYRAELDNAVSVRQRGEKLLSQNALADEKFAELRTREHVCRAQLEQAQAQKRSQQALGTRDADSELLRRERELAEAQASLALLESGPRPEEIAAEDARLLRLREELQYLDGLQEKSVVASPVAGFVTTPRLTEKVGQFIREGEVIAVIEDPSRLQAEITLTDQESARVQPGQAVGLRARSVPLDTFTGQVERLALRAVKGEVQSTVVVHCRIEGPGAGLRPGTMGHARISTGRCSIGAWLMHRALRFLRTEFWW